MSKRKIIHIFVGVVSLASTLISCGSIAPYAPEIEIQQFSIPPQELSSISIPVKVDLTPYFKETNQSIPFTFKGEEQICEGVSYSYQFIRDSIKFSGIGSKLLFDVDGKYALKLNYCPKCTELFSDKGNCIIPRVYSSCGVGESMRKIEVGYSAAIVLTKDYKLTSTTQLRKIKTVTPCLVTVFNYDATTTLKEEVTNALQDLEKDIDAEISAVDLRPEMEETWTALSDAIDLEGYGFLHMDPQSVSISKIHFIGDTAYFNTIITAKPVILSNEVVDSINVLPDLVDFKKKEGFDITMDVFAAYDSLSSIITQNIHGTSVELKGKNIVFESVTILGAANSGIHLEVQFSGDKKGTLFLTGTPQFDSTTQTIDFPDMQFDIKTKDALLKSAKWMFNDKITKTIRSASQMDLTPYLDSLKTMIGESLNGELTDGVFMSGSVQELIINSIQPINKKLFIRVKSKGSLGISM
tara:strand:- start:69420 stop:70823 length:1404 start_codon:yes stop_codon:yes gene_type:complete